MNSKLKKNIWVYLAIAVAFYGWPWLLKTMSWGKDLQVINVLLLEPVLVLIVSAAYAKINGFKWYFSLLLALMWLPAILVYQNSTILIYAPIYGMVSFFSQGIGLLFYNKSNKSA